MTSTLARTSPTPDPWDDLYDFLDPARREKTGSDRDAVAEAACLEIRRKLVVFFAGRGCSEAEDLAVDALLRVASHCREVDVAGFSDRTGYFYGVARNVLHEWRRHETADVERREAFRTEMLRLPVADPRSWAETERVHRHLSSCLAALTERARRLILSYYAEDRAARIEHHRVMAEEFGRSVNSLRIEVHRIRKAVRECLTRRLREEAEASTPAGPGSAGRSQQIRNVFARRLI
jgi:RNA polymerase sigma factor (sigma-70 family)